MSDKALVFEGADAFYFGDTNADCPYAAGSRESMLWLDGWEEAKYDFNRRSALDLELELPKSTRGVKSPTQARGV